jgi:hypothetical protein
VNKCIKAIAIGTALTLSAQTIYETSIVENEEPKNKSMASVSTPLKDYPPLPEHGPHSQAGIVNTMDGIVAVTTSAAFSFTKVLG